MKKLLFIFAVVAAACTLISCDKSSKELVIDYLPFQSEKDGGWGLLGKDGKPLFKDKFDDEILWVVNGVFAVKTEDGISLYRTSENPKLIPGCEDLVEVGIMNDGLIPIVRKGKRIEYVDKNGKTKFVLNPYKGKEIVGVRMFFDGLAPIITEEHKCGFINTKGQVVIEPKYDYGICLPSGLCIVGKGEDDVLIDMTGKEIKRLSNNIRVEDAFPDGKILVSLGKGEDSRLALFDEKGEIIQKLPKEVREVLEIKGDYYIYEKGYHKVGVNNMENETVIRAKYEEIHFVGNNKFLAQKNDKWRLIDDKDNVIKTFEDEEGEEKYEKVYYLKDWDCLIGFINHDDEAELLNTKGEKISNDTFYIDHEILDVFKHLERYFFAVDLVVRSNYVDVDKTVSCIVNAISEDGIGNVKIGSNIQEWTVRYEITRYIDKRRAVEYGGYQDEHSVYVNSNIKGTFNTEFSLLAYSKSPIAEKYTEEDGCTRYKSSNANAKVDLLVLDLSLDITDNIKTTESLVNIVRDKMVAKGFKVTKQGELACELQKGDKTLCVYPTFEIESPSLSMALMLTSDRDIVPIELLEQLEVDYKERGEAATETITW